MTKKHNYYLDLAFQIAEKNLGKTGTNPSVGSIVVKKENILSTGVTSINGTPHSEFNALNINKNFNGATLYTTLEPCTHYGKSPPCTNIIIKKGIKNVIYAFEDPDKRTFKKGKKILSSNGINTKLVKSINYSEFYRSYFLNKKLLMPYISAKIAISSDYLTINKKEKWITNEFSRKIVHLLRSRNDCLVSTSKSVNQDNSLLNCRIGGLDNSKPDLFIVDLNLKLKKKLFLNKLLRKRKTFLITLKRNFKKTKIFQKLGYKILFIESLVNKEDFNLFYKKIFKMGYTRVLFETGLTFLNSLMKDNLINDLYIFKSKIKLGKNGKNNSSTKFLKKISPKLITINLIGDKLYKKEFKNV